MKFPTIAAALLLAFGLSACAPAPPTQTGTAASTSDTRIAKNCIAGAADGLDVSTPDGREFRTREPFSLIVDPTTRTAYYRGHQVPCAASTKVDSPVGPYLVYVCAIPATDERGPMVVSIKAQVGQSVIHMSYPDSGVIGEGINPRVGLAPCPG